LFNDLGMLQALMRQWNAMGVLLSKIVDEDPLDGARTPLGWIRFAFASFAYKRPRLPSRCGLGDL